MPTPYVRVGSLAADGQTLTWRWRPNIVRIPDVFLHCAAFLYADEDEATSESRAGGTVFNLCVDFEVAEEKMLVYFVTARHCIEKGFTTIRANAVGGGFAFATIPQERWHFHKDGSDIAVAVSQGLNKGPEITFLPAGLGVRRDHDIGIGDSIFMVGRLVLHDGRDTNIPSLRFGNISMMPVEPIPASKGLHADQEAFGVEMRSMGGFSGSPVFIYDDSIYDPLKSIRLLGLDYCHFNTAIDYQIVNAGVAGVIPAWKIHELLYEDGDVIAEREKMREQNWTKVTEDSTAPMIELDTGKVDRPGPDPERLQIDGTVEDVAKRVMDAGKPDEGEDG